MHRWSRSIGVKLKPVFVQKRGLRLRPHEDKFSRKIMQKYLPLLSTQSRSFIGLETIISRTGPRVEKSENAVYAALLLRPVRYFPETLVS